jgi:hypothetical protein
VYSLRRESLTSSSEQADKPGRWCCRDRMNLTLYHRRRWLSSTILGLLIASSLALVACGGDSSNSATPTPATASVSPATPQASASSGPAGSSATASAASGPGVRITSITSPVALGGMATLTAQTSPGASCSIVYIHPSGKTSTARELTPKSAASDGKVAWTWLISTGTSPVGDGTVTVTCDGFSAQAPIGVGQ